MKTFLTFCALALACCFAPQSSAKKAILIAHYGSSNSETRAKTINRITADAKAAFPNYEVREAYISPIVRKSMTKQGLESKSTTEALIALAAEGYDSVYVQSTTLLEGAEMAEVRKSTEEVAQFFKYIKTGNPLCYSPADCLTLVKILAQEKPANSRQAIIFAGHGNDLPSTATYCQLDHMLSAEGCKNVHVSTIEGYPTVAATITQLQQDANLKEVVLIPLLLVCGNHTHNDIAGEYAQALQAAGYSTQVVMKGLGENPLVRQLYVARIGALLSPERMP